MSTPVPTVEERLRSSLFACDTFTRCAILADEHTLIRIPPFTPLGILKLWPDMLDAIAQQLIAIKSALTVQALNLPAPLKGGGR